VGVGQGAVAFKARKKGRLLRELKRFENKVVGVREKGLEEIRNWAQRSLGRGLPKVW